MAGIPFAKLAGSLIHGDAGLAVVAAGLALALAKLVGLLTQVEAGLAIWQQVLLGRDCMV